MSDYQDKVVVVTGGAGGLGGAVARRFAAGGAAVIVADVNQQQGAEMASELGGSSRFVPLDVTDESSWQGVVTALRELGRPCSALVQAAGILDVASIADHEPERFRRVLDINLFGTWLGMHILGPSLRESGDGAIVNFSSTQGIYAKTNLGAYAASKWGVRGLTKTAALEFAPDRVRVMSIHPGPIRSDMSATFDPTLLAQMPIPRYGEPDEVAAMVWFMVVEATYSTGSEFVIDGGGLLGHSAPVATRLTPSPRPAPERG